MNYRQLIRLFVFCASTLASVHTAAAAEMSADLNSSPSLGPCEIKIEGRIAAGDYDKFRALFPEDFVGKGGPSVCLDSDGGDFVEGLKIAEFVADRHINTVLDQGSKCASACSWIFMAGVNWATGGTEIARTMHPRSFLAFHAPYVDPEVVRKHIDSASPAEVADAAVQYYKTAVAEIAEHVLMLARKRLTADTNAQIESSLLAEALSRTDNPLVIDTVGKVLRWNIPVSDADGAVPRSKNDISLLCRNALAKANDFWDWEAIYKNDVLGYMALYNAKSRTFFSQVTIDHIRSAACEIVVTFREDLASVEEIKVTANLPREQSVVEFAGNYDVRAPVFLSLPSYAFLVPEARLKDLTAGSSGKPSNVSALANLAMPSWCAEQSNKGSSEAIICGDAQLAAFDAVLAREYAGRVARLSGTQKQAIQLQQRDWIARRKGCATEPEDDDKRRCIHRSYLGRISQLRGSD